MERMSTIDAVWVNAEGDGPPVAVGSLSVFDGPAPGIEELRALVAQRLADAPRMRQRLAKDPLRVRQASWVDTEVDLRWHVREWPVLAPGDQAALEHAVGGLMRTPMHQDRPLWDMTLLTGLADGRWGLVQRLHHAVADGQGAVLLTGRLVDVAPSGGPTLTEALLEQMQAEAEPRTRGSRAFLAEAATKGGDLLLRAMKTVTTTEGLDTLTSQLPQTPGPLAGHPGNERAWTQTAIALRDVKKIRAALGGTVNDVVMALVSGGYRELYRAMGLDPEAATVRVLVPVSLRSPGDLASNNQVGGLLVVLPLGGPAVDRYADIREHLDAVKEASSPQLYSALYAAVDATVPAFVQSLVVRSVGGKFGSLYTDSLVTNVPGPQFPVYVAGRRAQTMVPLIPLGEPLRLTIGVLSYDGTLFAGITGGRGVEGDVQAVARGMLQALMELLAAATAVESAEHR